MHVFAHLGQTACEAQLQSCLQQCEQAWLWEDGQPIPVNQPSANYPDYFACVQQCPKCPGSPNIPINQGPTQSPEQPAAQQPAPEPPPTPSSSGAPLVAVASLALVVGIFVAVVR